MTRADWKCIRGQARAWQNNPSNRAGSFDSLSARGRIYRDAVPFPLLANLSDRDRAAALIGKPGEFVGRLPRGPRALAFASARPVTGQFKGMVLSQRVSLRRALRGDGISEAA